MKRLFTWGWGARLLAVLVLIGGGVLLTLAFAGNQTSPSQSQENEIVTVYRGDLTASASASGQIKAGRRAEVALRSPGEVAAVFVAVGDEVEAGDVLLQLDSSDLALNVATAELNLAVKAAALDDLLAPASALELAAAEADVASAQAALNELQNGPSPEEIAISESSVMQATAALYSSSASLSDTTNSVTTADLEAAKAAVVAAEYELKQARERNETFANVQTDSALQAAEEAHAEASAEYSRLLNGVDDNELGASQADLSAAAARLNRSQADFDALLDGATAVELANAAYTLANAQASLTRLIDGPSAAEIAIAEAELAQARLDLSEAEARLAETAVTAPFDGVVSAVHVQPGETASGTVVELLDLASLTLVLQVDEADLATLAVGLAADVTLETWPETPIASTIEAIAPSATTDSSGVVAYDVHLSLGDTPLPVRVGMTADARLTTAKRTDVLLVPNAAVRADRQSGKFYVNLSSGGTVVETEIMIGLRDEQVTQVIDGLAEGDALVINYETDETSERGGSFPPRPIN